MLIVLLLPNVLINNSFASYISGIGFGNSGLRFTSFATCDDKIHFFKDSEISFKASSNNNLNNKNQVNGTWEIKFNQFNQNIPKVKSGNIINSTIYNNLFLIIGKESIDSICNNNNNLIMITGQCGKNNPIYIFSNDNEKLGSLSAPKGDKIYYLFGDQIICK